MGAIVESDEITEDFSEIAPKRKRGRPGIFDAVESAGPTFRNLYQDDHGRTLTNRLYQVRALRRLMDNPDFAWLLETDVVGGWRRGSLLIELGRFPDDESAELAARRMCERKPKVRDGIVILRRWRLQCAGKAPALSGDPQLLGSDLLRTVNDFIVRYPETSSADILAALGAVTDDVKAHFGID